MTPEDFRARLLFDFEKETDKLTDKIAKRVVAINEALQPYYQILLQTRNDLKPTFQFVQNGFNGFMGYLSYKDGKLALADIGGIRIKFKHNKPTSIKITGERKASECYDYAKELSDKLDKISDYEFVQNCLNHFE